MAGPTTIDWGDGSPVENGPEQGQVSHQYATPGAKTAVVADADNPQARTEVTFTLPFDVGGEPEEMEVTAGEDTTDASRMTASITVDNRGQGPVTLDFGDGTPAGSNSGDGQEATPHPYAAPGDYTVTARDADDTTRTGTAQVTVPFGEVADITLTIEEDTADTTGMSVNALIDNQGNQALVDFGDGTEPQTNPGDGQTPTGHAFTTPGDYAVTATDTVDASRTTSQQVTVPFDGGGTEPTAQATADASDPTGRTALLSYSGFPADSTVAIDWGDGTAPETGHPAEGELTYAYAQDVTGTVTITLTSETDPQLRANAAFTPGEGAPAEPTVTAEADPADATGRTALITLSGFPAADALTVDWGDGTQPESLPAGTAEATHAFAESVTGEVAITVTSQADPSVTASATFTPGGGQEPPEPTLTAEADPSDATGRTALITLTGFPAEADIEVDWGDGTPVTVVPAGQTQSTHAYDENISGDQTITATSTADLAVIASTTFTPGGQQPGTGPQFTVAPGQAANSAVITVTVTDSETYTIQWDDQPVVDVPASGVTAEQVLAPGAHTVTVCVSGAEPARCTEQQVTIPLPAAAPRSRRSSRPRRR
ncbi:hypothetical protein [Streptomyces sp. MP131-18]|uniref:hypothetical protein n=1 Tax=Streptomyces sp. MP131-18 TaxID=1857892 RepID=UPI00097CBE6E|nr:hypothetical protein [Streptomyces sp. MP131-18]ONK13141.1 hypothetical protein STBA_39030 [Streptomyces sp. MP131-18]